MGTDNNSSSNNGNKGRFSDRLKKMRRDRLKRAKNATLENEDKTSLRTIGRNILKVILAIPSIVYTNIVKDTDKESSKDNQIKGASNDNWNLTSLSTQYTINDNLFSASSDKRDKVNIIRNIDVSSIEKSKKENPKNAVFDDNALVKETKLKNGDAPNFARNGQEYYNHASKGISYVDEKVKLQKEIVGLIKKKLVNTINQLEVLQSEFYVLNELGVEDVDLSKCQEDIKEIKKLLSKVKALKEKYDYLRENVDFEYMLEYGDDLLVDKILELKEICSMDTVRATVQDYKILDEYKYLYLKIDKLQEDTIKFEEKKNKKAEELRQRDLDFDKLKESIYDTDRENERYDSFVKEQELLLKELDENVSQIESKENVTYHLKGFNKLLGNSFKYLGLLLVNPLKGLVPGIATQTLITKNVVHNLYRNLEWEENRRMVYDAIDYSDSINSAIHNLDNTASLVDSTLEDIVRLKSKYQQQFSKYESSFSSYQEAIKKINKIENAVLGSKVKIEIMRERMKEKKRENTDKLKMIKKLNSSNKAA